MQKKIIVLAIAAALSAPAVALADSANVTLYGAANMSADYITTGDVDATGGAKGVSKLVVSSNQTFFGLKGSEDLGNGMSALWQIEQVVAMDNAGGTLATRNSYLALKNNMGMVLMGRHDTPYKMSTRKLDVFADGLADNRALMGGVSGKSAAASFDGRQPDVLAYVSPTFANITAAIARVNLSEDRTVSGSTSAHAISLAGMYNNGPFYGSVAYEEHNFKGVAPAGIENSENAVKVGFGYTQDAFSVGVAFEQTSDDFAAGKKDQFGHTAIYVGGKYNLASGSVKLAYAQADELGDAISPKNGATQISLGYDHNLSKRTVAYVAYTMVSNDKNASYSLATTSTAGSTSVTGAGADPSALSVGIKHSF